MCDCATSEREREKQSSSLFFIIVLVKSSRDFCVRSTDESRASNVVLQQIVEKKKKYEHPKQCNTP